MARPTGKPIRGTWRPSARTAVSVPFRMAIIRGTPAIVTGSERELWKAISKPSTSDCATSERRSGGEVEEGADEGRGGEGDGQPEDDADALPHGRAALSEGEAEPGQDDSDDADRLGDGTGERLHHRGERALPGHCGAATSCPSGAGQKQADAG